MHRFAKGHTGQVIVSLTCVTCKLGLPQLPFIILHLGKVQFSGKFPRWAVSTSQLVPGISSLCFLRAGITGRLSCLREAYMGTEDSNSCPCLCGKCFACWVISPAILQVLTGQIHHCQVFQMPVWEQLTWRLSFTFNFNFGETRIILYTLLDLVSSNAKSWHQQKHDKIFECSAI